MTDLTARIEAWLADPGAFTEEDTAALLMDCAEALDATTPLPRETRPTLPQPTPGLDRILLTIREAPGLTVGDVAATLGVSYSTVTHGVRRLKIRGLVKATREGKYRHLYPAEAA